MPNPENVKQSQAFTLNQIIYNHDDFSIATGHTIGIDESHLAMRWNGEKDGVGFPRAFNHSLWFPIEKKLTRSILLGLKSHQKNLSSDEIMKIEEAIGVLK